MFYSFIRFSKCSTSFFLKCTILNNKDLTGSATPRTGWADTSWGQGPYLFCSVQNPMPGPHLTCRKRPIKAAVTCGLPGHPSSSPPIVVAVTTSKERIAIWWKATDYCMWQHWQWWPQERILAKRLTRKNIIAPPTNTEFNNWRAKAGLGKWSGSKKKGIKAVKKKQMLKNTK